MTTKKLFYFGIVYAVSIAILYLANYIAISIVD